MGFENQLLFFLSAIGAFNGLFLSIYFAFLINNRSRNTYFLAALLFVISIRVTKSVFFTFYSNISGSFIQLGLTALSLIGPFLYLYISSTIEESKLKSSTKWIWHIVPVFFVMIIIGYYFPYFEYKHLWQRRYDGYLNWLLYLQWFIYIILAGKKIKFVLKKVLFKRKQLEDQDFWLVSIFLGVTFIFIAYLTSGYTSYIVGALSFSFSFYLIITIWIFKRKKRTASYLSKPVKYANKKINSDESENISKQLTLLFEEKELHKNPDLKLPELAKLIGVKTYYLSQYFNDNIKKSFATYINEYRIESATKMIESNNLLTIEAIGNECGFRSNSSFYTAFKKIKGLTPAQYKKSLQ